VTDGRDTEAFPQRYPEPSASSGTVAHVLRRDQKDDLESRVAWAIENARTMYFSALGRLAEIALVVEAAVAEADAAEPA
jgi:hypothetical protein